MKPEPAAGVAEGRHVNYMQHLLCNIDVYACAVHFRCEFFSGAFANGSATCWQETRDPKLAVFV